MVSVTLTPEFARLLESLDVAVRDSEQSLRDEFFSWLLIATGAVVIGIILEGPEVLHELRSALHQRELHKPKWMVVIGFFGWLLIVVGVSSELISEKFVSQADLIIQNFNNIGLVYAEKQSADAIVEAANADERARIAESTNRTLQQQLRTQGEEARRDARALEKHAEDERTARVKIEQAVAWRHLSSSQVEAIRKAIPLSIAGLKIEVRHLLNDPEASRYGSEIADALRPKLDVDGSGGYLAGWGIIPYGVGLYVKSPSIFGAAELQKALQAGGVNAPAALLSAANLTSTSGIVVFVWLSRRPQRNRRPPRRSARPPELHQGGFY